MLNQGVTAMNCSGFYIRESRSELLPPQKLSQPLQVLFKEIRQGIFTLLRTGQSHLIDIGNLPLVTEDYNQLRRVLGKGAVTAVIHALGQAKIKETKLSGVWWITHYNSNGDVIGELLEITVMPEIMETQYVDIQDTLNKLDYKPVLS